ncbi:transposase [Vibrio parahaemolyticus]|nr:transposase [Vibrio parahaemolyticus]EJG0563830.1 transposase [Vibrio parahaemolyticus]
MANDFKNVSVIKLSPYSPELNPIEQVWSWLRQRDLSNQSFFYGLRRHHLQSLRCIESVWDCSKRVTKICSRKWIDLTS